MELGWPSVELFIWDSVVCSEQSVGRIGGFKVIPPGLFENWDGKRGLERLLEAGSAYGNRTRLCALRGHRPNR
jgi:hypothetical protein